MFYYENIFKPNSEDEFSEPATIPKEKNDKKKTKTSEKSEVWQHFVKKKLIILNTMSVMYTMTMKVNYVAADSNILNLHRLLNLIGRVFKI